MIWGKTITFFSLKSSFEDVSTGTAGGRLVWRSQTPPIPSAKVLASHTGLLSKPFATWFAGLKANRSRAACVGRALGSFRLVVAPSASHASFFSIPEMKRILKAGAKRILIFELWISLAVPRPGEGHNSCTMYSHLVWKEEGCTFLKATHFNWVLF